MKGVLIGFLLLLVFSPVFVSAQNYYVDATNGDDSNDGLSPETAWKTIYKANNEMESGIISTGDDILFKRGETFSDYNLWIRVGGNASDYMIIGDYGSGDLPTFSGCSIILKEGTSYVKVQNVRVENTTATAINLARPGIKSVLSTNIQVLNCEVINAGRAGIDVQGIDTYLIDGCLVEGCGNGGIVIYGSPTVRATNGIVSNNIARNITNEDGMAIHRDGNLNPAGPNHTLINNDCYGNQENGLDIYPGYQITVEGNIFHDNHQANVVISGDSTDIIFRRNYVYGGNHHAITLGQISSITLEYNVVHDPKYCCLEFAPGAGILENVTLYNNDFISTARAERPTIRIWDGLDTFTVKNNIIMSTGDTPTLVSFGGSTTPENTNSFFDYNQYYRTDNDSSKTIWYGKGFADWQSQYGQDTHGNFGDPKLVNSGTDYRLQADSPCIDAGTDLGLTQDFEGNPVPQGGVPDIGAYEYKAQVTGNVYYVSPSGSDSNPGTESKPFKTVQKGINSAGSGETVYIKSGTYDLSGFSKSIDYPLTIIGEDKNSTILRNGGTLTFSDSLTVKNLKFTNYDAVLRPLTMSGKTIDGVFIDNCIFEDVLSGLRLRKRYEGAITNVDISSCEFLNMSEGKVYAVVISDCLISNIRITNNVFKNLDSKSDTKGASAILIGSNYDRNTTKDVFISGNDMDTIIGGTVSSDGINYPETHGILAYGTNISILGNRVKNLNAAQDHEAIYMKARDSIIANNIIENCGSGAGGADITNKGGAEAGNNVISGNRITGDQPGRGILSNGDVIIENNYVKKTNGLNGIDAYGYDKPVKITGNHAETKIGTAIRLEDGINSVISENLAISYEGSTIKVKYSSGTQVNGNIECAGYNCSGLTPPNPTCQNMGYLCCDSCQSGQYPEYDEDCAGQVCCGICGLAVPVDLSGDIDNDGDVDIEDLILVATNFGKTSGFDPRADVIPNSEIDIYDMVFIASRFS